MFSSISSCGALRFAPCKVTLHGRGPCLIAFLLVAAFPVGSPPQVAKNGPFSQGPIQRIYQRRGRVDFQIFGLVGLHFLAFWLCTPSFPFILALWAFISLHFGLVGFHFCPFWPCGPSFPCILALWAFISLHFGPVGLHFLAFRPCGPSFPCILALWAFISFHFGLVGLHFLAFWPCGLSFPCILALHVGLVGHHFLAFWPCGPSFPCILALWAFISLHFGLVGLHFLAFWPCGLSFPCILAFSGSASGVPPQVARNGPFAQRPYNGFISAVTGSILQFLTFWAFISLYFGLVGLHSFPCILALSAFISLYFGLVGLHFSFSASILAFGASILPLRALRGGILWLCVLLGLQGGYPFTLCGFLSLQGGILHNFGPPTFWRSGQICQAK